MIPASSDVTYPVLPLNKAILFPHLLMPVAVGHPAAVEAVQAAQSHEPARIIAAIQRDPAGPGIQTLHDLYPIATVATVVRVLPGQENVVQILLQGIERVQLVALDHTAPYLQAAAIPLNEPQDTSDETIALGRNIKTLVAQAVEHLGVVPPELASLLLQTEEPVQLAYLVAAMLQLDTDQAFELLEHNDLSSLLQGVYVHLVRELQIMKLQRKIADAAQEELDQTQRDFFLRQQLKQIKQELGEGEEQDDVGQLRQRLDATELPDSVRTELDRELHRLQRLNPAAPDYQVAWSYVEFALELPWSASTTDQHDLAQAQTILDEDHFGLDDVKDRIIEHLAVMQLKPEATSPILCLVGPPGVGKTSLGQSVARALGRRFERFSLGGVHDEAELRGHRRTYVGALPGRILQAIRRAGVRNPVLMLDEVDKLGRDFRGDPASALLEILDPAQNHTFRDHYVDVPFDLSHTFFICTANSLDTIPAPLRDRMEILTLSGYSEEEKLAIARQYLIPRQVEHTGLDAAHLPLTDAGLQRLISHYTREAGVRQLERTIGRVAQKIARQVVLQAALPERLEPEDLEDLLGPEAYRIEAARQHLPPGVVAGLAVTPSGGDILYIEAVSLPGGKGLTLTGQLGDVMRESAEIARHLLWSEATGLALDPSQFEANGFHIHVPAGATPKDGPSAGTAMVTALTSLLTNRSVRADTAMTGEITLSGLVLPVGGIKEKVLAARRAGLRRVILPKANAKDLRHLPAAVCEEMELIFVERFSEVIHAAIPALELTPYTEVMV
ncbi:MAG: endopeptidase La [Candidatus Tectomicrobia bacterium]